MIVEHFENLIDKYNTDNQCGFCWNFIYGRKDYTNLELKKGKECCIQFMLEWWKLKVKRNLNNDRDYTERHEYQFKAFVGLNSDFTIQYHNELDYDKSEGKYEMYIKKIEECLLENFETDMCADPFTRLDDWTYEPKINYKDSNFDGGFLTGTIYFEKE